MDLLLSRLQKWHPPPALLPIDKFSVVLVCSIRVLLPEKGSPGKSVWALFSYAGGVILTPL